MSHLVNSDDTLDIFLAPVAGTGRPAPVNKCVMRLLTQSTHYEKKLARR